MMNANASPLLIPPQPVGTRRCANCACYYTIAGAPPGQNSFCGLEPPVSSPVRVEVPRLGRDGQPVMVQRRDQPSVPATDSVQGFGFAHRPTQPNLVCFNGWRPLNARPGERAVDARNRGLVEALMPLAREVVTEAQTEAPPGTAAKLGALLAAIEGAIAEEPPPAPVEAPPGALNS